MFRITKKLCLQSAKRKRKPAGMKIRWIFALGLLVAVLISCQCLRKRSSQGAVQIGEHSILIPGTAISTADQEALNKIFRKYDGSVYRVAVYENGSLKKQIGKMKEMRLADVTKDYARNATAIGLSSWIFQLGARTHVTHYPPTTTVIRPPGQPTHVTTGQTTHVTTGEPTHVTTGQPTHVTHPDFTSIEQESDALVKEVTPILEKYSK
jgi:hypothetical protein